LKRIVTALTGAALAVGLGAGATAWAGPGRSPADRATARACLEDARRASPDADRAAVREAARPCLEAAGLAGRPRTPEQQAAREALRECLRTVRQAHPDADREERRELARAQGRPPGYDGRCRTLTREQIAAFEAEGRTPVVRFRVPDGSTTFADLIRGPVTFEHTFVPDFVLVRADGQPLYTLAVAVDDVLMGITHVLRGEDLLASTPRQLAVYAAMGVQPGDVAAFGHLPYVMGPDNTRLSKRHGAVSIAAYRQDGYLPEALVNYLALLGWSIGGDREDFSLQEMADAFTVERVNANAARFDVRKLQAINGDKIRALDPADFAERLMPFLQRAGHVAHPPTEAEERIIAGAAPLVQERVGQLTEAVAMLGFLFVDEAHFTVDEEAAARALTPESAAVLDAALRALEDTAAWEAAAIEGALRDALVDTMGLKPKHAFSPVRIAVTGRRVSPPLFESLELLGRDRTLERLRQGLRTATS